jgi:hypothetical protein
LKAASLELAEALKAASLACRAITAAFGSDADGGQFLGKFFVGGDANLLQLANRASRERTVRYRPALLAASILE